MAQIEWSYYIPPDVTVYADGTIPFDEWDDVYSFHDGEDRFEMSFTGWGMPGVEYVTQRGPFQHGETVLDYRLKPRVIQLQHRRNGGCRYDYWDFRSALINAIRPNRGTCGFQRGRLRRILPDGKIRDLYVVIEAGPRFETRGQNWDEWSIMETLRFVAHDPVIFNPVQQSATWSLVTTDHLVFPITFPILFGGAIIDDALDVTYGGTWLTYPVITIVGPLNGPRILNNSTDEKIEIDYDVPIGSTLVIDLNYSIKTVIENGITNRIGTVTEDSDLATFHIAPHPEVAGGVNELQVLGSSADGNTAVSIAWYDKYIGI